MGPVSLPGGADAVAHALLLHARLCDHQDGLRAVHQHEHGDVPKVSAVVNCMRNEVLVLLRLKTYKIPRTCSTG